MGLFNHGMSHFTDFLKTISSKNAHLLDRLSHDAMKMKEENASFYLRLMARMSKLTKLHQRRLPYCSENKTRPILRRILLLEILHLKKNASYIRSNTRNYEL